jgi:hypothetical protein
VRLFLTNRSEFEILQVKDSSTHKWIHFVFTGKNLHEKREGLYVGGHGARPEAE